MRAFTLVVPHTLADASDAAKKPNTLLKAAGIDVVDRLKERIEAPAEVVNLLGMKKDLAYVRAADGGLQIGALTTLNEVETAKEVQDRAFDALRLAAGTTATPLVRNRATIAGNLLQLARCWYLRSAAFGCLHGGKGPACLAMSGENRYHSIMGWHDCVRVHPSNLAPALLALGAEYTTQLGEQQQRRKLSELFPKEPKAQKAEHTLLPGEIVTAIHVPAPVAGQRSSYRESREKESFDWATTSAAVRLVIDGGAIKAADIVLGAVAPVPMPKPDVAKLLLGKAPSDELFVRAAELAFQGAMPLQQNAYKLTVGKAVLRQALLDCTR